MLCGTAKKEKRTKFHASFAFLRKGKGYKFSSEGGIDPNFVELGTLGIITQNAISLFPFNLDMIITQSQASDLTK